MEGQTSFKKKIDNLFDALFGEFSEMARFIVGYLLFMAVFMSGFMLFGKLGDALKSTKVTGQEAQYETDSKNTITALDRTMNSIDSLINELEMETNNKKTILRYNVGELQKIEKANYLVDSIGNAHGVSYKSSARLRALTKKDYLNWIMTAIITLAVSFFFYRLGRRAEKRKLQKQISEK